MERGRTKGPQHKQDHPQSAKHRTATQCICACKVQEGWPPNPLLNNSSVSIEGGSNMGKGASSIGKDRGWGDIVGKPRTLVPCITPSLRLSSRGQSGGQGSGKEIKRAGGKKNWESVHLAFLGIYLGWWGAERSRGRQIQEVPAFPGPSQHLTQAFASLS